MDQIEKKVRMPAGSRPLAEYARYYAFDKRGHVIAVYTTFLEPSYTSLNLPAGHRRCVSDEGKLPSISDGGCGVVEVRFDPTAEEVLGVACNGLAYCPLSTQTCRGSVQPKPDINGQTRLQVNACQPSDAW
ncbi:hypothetical protein GCM10022276_03920 [Sphingomonas limnosediminicola]|uniref:Uncharacterized protein n=1 Tax=Sphingomonas limnosediminicola TaxID=940133 RepID=A0ABP7KX44_9SPHN